MVLLLLALLAFAGVVSGCGGEPDNPVPLSVETTETTPVVNDEPDEGPSKTPGQVLADAQDAVRELKSGHTTSSSQDFDGHTWTITDFDLSIPGSSAEIASFQPDQGRLWSSASPEGVFIGWFNREGGCWIELTSDTPGSDFIPNEAALVLDAKVAKKPTEREGWVAIEVPVEVALEASMTGLSDLLEMELVASRTVPAELLVDDTGVPKRVDIDVDALGDVLDDAGLDENAARERSMLLGSNTPELEDPDRFDFFKGTVMVAYSMMGSSVEVIVPERGMSIPWAPKLESLSWPEICSIASISAGAQVS